MTSQYFDDILDAYMCGRGDLMTSQSGRGLVLICMERGLVNNGIALILGCFGKLMGTPREISENTSISG